jgi:hypothetical protein
MPAFSVESPDHFVSHNTLQIATGKEIVSPWNRRNLGEFFRTFISFKLPLSYKQLFGKPWFAPFLRGVYEKWQYLISDSVLASGITFTVVPKNVSILWFPPLFPDLYTKTTKLLLHENLLAAKTFDSIELDIQNLQSKNRNPVIFDLDTLSISSNTVRKLLEISLISFAVGEIECTSALDGVTRSRLERKVKRATSKLHSKNVRSGAVICIPAAGRSIMILKNVG